MAEVGLDGIHLASQVGDGHELVRRVDDPGGFVVVVEEGEESEVIVLSDGIELVIVTLGALDGEAEHGFADGIHAVEEGFHAELLGIDSPPR